MSIVPYSLLTIAFLTAVLIGTYRACQWIEHKHEQRKVHK